MSTQSIVNGHDLLLYVRLYAELKCSTWIPTQSGTLTGQSEKKKHLQWKWTRITSTPSRVIAATSRAIDIVICKPPPYQI